MTTPDVPMGSNDRARRDGLEGLFADDAQEARADGVAQKDGVVRDGGAARKDEVARGGVASVGERAARADRVRWGLLAGWVVLVVLAVVTGTWNREPDSPGVLAWVDTPLWVSALSLGFNLALFIHVAVSPRRPWAATRWAWFWLCVTPIGAPLYLVFSGPAKGLPVRDERHRRTPGYLGFLVMVFFPK